MEIGYYQINNTKKILYWDGEKWLKPIKDHYKRFGSYLEHLEKQPTNVKITTPVEETEYKWMFKNLWDDVH